MIEHLLMWYSSPQAFFGVICPIPLLAFPSTCSAYLSSHLSARRETERKIVTDPSQVGFVYLTFSSISLLGNLLYTREISLSHGWHARCRLGNLIRFVPSEKKTTHKITMMKFRQGWNITCSWFYFPSLHFVSLILIPTRWLLWSVKWRLVKEVLKYVFFKFLPACLGGMEAALQPNWLPIELSDNMLQNQADAPPCIYFPFPICPSTNLHLSDSDMPAGTAMSSYP